MALGDVLPRGRRGQRSAPELGRRIVPPVLQ